MTGSAITAVVAESLALDEAAPALLGGSEPALEPIARRQSPG